MINSRTNGLANLAKIYSMHQWIRFVNYFKIDLIHARSY